MLPPHRWDAAALAQARPAAQTSSTVVLASLPVAAAQVSAAGTPWHSGPLASRHTCLPQLTHPHLLTQPDSSQAQVRYLLRVTVARSLGGSVVKDHAFWVRNTQEVPPPGPPIKVRYRAVWQGNDMYVWRAALLGGTAAPGATLKARGAAGTCSQGFD